MAYTINRYSGATLATVQDGTVDATSDLRFVGKNYAGYGEIQNENFLFLLENFSGTSQPPKAVSGQVWYDSSVQKLKFYNGTRFKNTGGAEVSATQPTSLTSGDFWWDSGNNQLYAFDGTSFILVGPQSTGSGVTQMRSKTVKDTTSTNRSVIAATINDEVVYLISSIEFTIDSTDASNAITGFDVVKKGLTMINTLAATNGVTTTDHVYWGTASNALRLGGNLASDFLLSSSGSFTDIVRFADAGLTVGDSNDLLFKIENGNDGVISNQVGTNSIIKVKANNSAGAETHSTTFTALGITPASSNAFDIGASGNVWANVYATSFQGNASSASSLKLSGTVYAPDQSATANTAALRDASGNLTANLFQGIATQARYADLAENYTTDQEHPTGTIMCVGGEAETKAAGASNYAIGVISAEPAYLMNSALDGQAIALKGRVPVIIQGPVSKGQPVYAWSHGVGSTIASTAFVGIALESSEDIDEKLIECVLKV
jgi:hypothetical protein